MDSNIIVTTVDGSEVRIDPAAGRVEVAGRAHALQVAAGSGQGEFEDDEE